MVYKLHLIFLTLAILLFATKATTTKYVTNNYTNAIQNSWHFRFAANIQSSIYQLYGALSSDDISFDDDLRDRYSRNPRWTFSWDAEATGVAIYGIDIIHQFHKTNFVADFTLFFVL